MEDYIYIISVNNDSGAIQCYNSKTEVLIQNFYLTGNFRDSVVLTRIMSDTVVHQLSSAIQFMLILSHCATQ